jgi:hypothetical protein
MDKAPSLPHSSLAESRKGLSKFVLIRTGQFKIVKKNPDAFPIFNVLGPVKCPLCKPLKN